MARVETTTGVRTGDRGIHVPRTTTETLDVLFDGQRVWSFNPQRDGKAESAGQLLVEWPAPLLPFLDGRSDVVLREHVSGKVLFDEPVTFGSGAGRARVVDKHGEALAVDKTGRLVRMFSDSAGANLELLVEETERLLTVLNNEGGVPSYLSYGGLLGAVRSGRMIGHDCDLDIAFLSGHTHPADIIAESYRLERLVIRHGWSTRRMSGDDFKVIETMDDGTTIGIDVFGSFYVDDVFHLMPETRGELPRAAITPLSKVELEGRPITAPADPEALLALTYGESWRVPDPAFKFETPVSTQRRLGGWMRGERVNLRHWDKVYAGPATPGPVEPSAFAEWVAEQLPQGGRLVEIGVGAGNDSIFFARQGHDVVGYDYSGSALRRARQQRSGLDDVSLRFLRLNLYETREVLTHAGLRAHRGPTEAIYARRLLEALRDDARRNVWTYARMVLRGGGRLFLEFRVPLRGGERGGRSGPIRYLDPETVVAEIEAAGGVVEQRDVKRGLAGLRQNEDPALCRLVVRWS